MPEPTPFGFEEPWRSPGFMLWRMSTAWQRDVNRALVAHDLTHLQFVLLAVSSWLGSRPESTPTQVAVAKVAVQVVERVLRALLVV